MSRPDTFRFSRRNLLLATATILLGGIGFLGLWRANESRDALTAFESRLTTLRAWNEGGRETLAFAEESSVRDSIAVYSDSLRVLERLIPSSGELPDLLEDIAIEARTSAVEVTFLHPIGAGSEGEFARFTYGLGLSGRFRDIDRFITRITSLPRLVTPGDLVLLAGEEVDAAGSPPLDARLVIHTYTTSSPAPDAPPTP